MKQRTQTTKYRLTDNTLTHHVQTLKETEVPNCINNQTGALESTHKDQPYKKANKAITKNFANRQTRKKPCTKRVILVIMIWKSHTVVILQTEEAVVHLSICPIVLAQLHQVKSKSSHTQLKQKHINLVVIVNFYKENPQRRSRPDTANPNKKESFSNTCAKWAKTN